MMVNRCHGNGGLFVCKKSVEIVSVHQNTGGHMSSAAFVIESDLTNGNKVDCHVTIALNQ